MPRQPHQILSHAEELAYCERVYLDFVLRYAGGSVAEAAKLAKVGRGSFYHMLTRRKIDVRDYLPGGPAYARKLGDTLAAKEKGPKKIEIVLAAVKGKAKSAREIHAEIGGSFGSLTVYLSRLHMGRRVVVSGPCGAYRYKAAT